MFLYLVTGEVDNGENADWFVVAREPEEAVTLWKNIDYVKEDGDSNPTPDQVFLVTELAKDHPFYGSPRALAWQEDIRKVVSCPKPE